MKKFRVTQLIRHDCGWVGRSNNIAKRSFESLRCGVDKAWTSPHLIWQVYTCALRDSTQNENRETTNKIMQRNRINEHLS